MELGRTRVPHREAGVGSRSEALAGEHADAEVVVVPLGRHADRRKVKAVLIAAAYARGGETSIAQARQEAADERLWHEEEVRGRYGVARG